MFEIQKHLAYSENCFERPHKPGNRDLCICTEFDSLPSQFGKGMIRIVMDGISQGHGKEAVEAAAPSLYLNLAGELMRISRELSLTAEEIGSRAGTGPSIGQFLKEQMHRVLLDSLRKANQTLRRLPEDSTYCTVSIAVLFHRYLFTANLGDSPILLMDLSDPEPKLRSLYDMDNEAGAMITRGELTEEEALHSGYQNGLLRFLGFERWDILEDGNIHFRMTRMPESFVLLLGSDGALAQLPRPEMAQMLSRHLENDNCFQGFLEELKEAVHEAGSVDDFTLLMDLVASD